MVSSTPGKIKRKTAGMPNANTNSNIRETQKIGNSKISNMGKYIPPDVKIEVDMNQRLFEKSQSKSKPQRKRSKSPKISKSGSEKTSKQSDSRRDRNKAPAPAPRGRDKSPKPSKPRKEHIPLPPSAPAPKERSLSPDKVEQKKRELKEKLKQKKKEKAEAAAAAMPTFMFQNKLCKEDLVKELEKTKKTLEDCELDRKAKLAELKKESGAKKAALDKEIFGQIDAKRKASEKGDQFFERLQFDSNKIIEKLREENKKLRATKDKLPKQNKEISISNENLIQANEEVANHFKSLGAFTKKLSVDHDRLQKSNDECKDSYIPRYRRELRDRQAHIDAESRIKRKYRDTMIKVGNRCVQTRNPTLVDIVSTIIIEIEGELNPKFDPKVLFDMDNSDSDSDKGGSDSDSDSDSD